MAVDGETLWEYNMRVGLATPTTLRNLKMDKLDNLLDRKSEYPPIALRLFNEVQERRRLETEKKLGSKNQKTQ